MWPGSSVPHSYKAADYVVEYQRNVSATDKMDTVLGWLDLPFDKRPHMISVYIPQVDQKGHGGGPHGSQLNGVLSAMDKAVEHLLVGLQQRHLDQHIHTVIVSDHGMAATHASHLIYYDTILPRALLPYLRREAWPLLNLRPTQDAPAHTVEKAYQALYHYTQTHPHPHFQVYLRHQVPDRFHYMRTERIAPIVAIPDPGYSFVTEQEFNASLGAEYRPRGMHGYDPQAVDMRAIFMANGPIVRKEYGQGMVASFENVQLYEFLVYLLGLVPAPNNGTLHGRFNQYA
ncbi:alkaline-phosphatase-like protein [Spinellus fusiger]|nr:alkaline-phosphatase-like protein [Spinellus fusiger]